MFHDRLTAQRNIKSYFVLIAWLLFFYSGIWTHQLSDEHLSTAVLVATYLDIFNMMVTFSWCIGGKKISYFWDQTFSSHVGGDSNTDRRHILVTTWNRKLTFNISVVYRNIHSFFWLSWRINISDLCVLQLYTHTTLIVVSQSESQTCEDGGHLSASSRGAVCLNKAKQLHVHWSNWWIIKHTLDWRGGGSETRRSLNWTLN